LDELSKNESFILRDFGCVVMHDGKNKISEPLVNTTERWPIALFDQGNEDKVKDVFSENGE
jgi:hypothetical protein